MKPKKTFFYNGKEYEILYSLLCDISIEDMQNLYDFFDKKDEDFSSFVKSQIPGIFNSFQNRHPGWINFFIKIYSAYISGYSDNSVLKLRLSNIEKFHEQQQINAALKESMKLASAKKIMEKEFHDMFEILPPAQRNTVIFGKYPFEEDGTEAGIEWIETARMGDHVLICCCHGIDAVPFNESAQDNDFASSSLAEWLKNDFLNKAFSDEEKMRIEEGPFILSEKEAEKYFPENKDRLLSPTPFAAKKGVPMFKNGCSWWWLAAPGSMSNTAAYVSYSGKIKMAGDFVYLSSIAVRPAMIIKKNGTTEK